MSFTIPNWHTSALTTIDMQNDFTLPDAPAEITGTIRVVPKLTRLLEAYRVKGLPIVHAVRLYKEDGSNVDICRREAVQRGARIVVPGTKGAELAQGIRPPGSDALDADRLLTGDFQTLGEREWAMYKPRWGAFYQTGLESFLRGRGIDTIVFAGCNFPNCPRTSIYEASERDFRIAMAADSMSQVYDKGLEELRNIGVHVCAAEDILLAVERAKGRWT